MLHKTTALALIAGLALVGCEQSEDHSGHDHAEDVVEQAESAATDAGNAMEEAAEEAGDAVEDAADQVEDAVDESTGG